MLKIIKHCRFEATSQTSAMGTLLGLSTTNGVLEVTSSFARPQDASAANSFAYAMIKSLPATIDVSAQRRGCCSLKERICSGARGDPAPRPRPPNVLHQLHTLTLPKPTSPTPVPLPLQNVIVGWYSSVFLGAYFTDRKSVV